MLSASACVVLRSGRRSQVMTNMRPKTYFLRPDVAIPLGFALVRELWNQKVSACPAPPLAAATFTALVAAAKAAPALGPAVRGGCCAQFAGGGM